MSENFIRIIPNALSTATCAETISAFESSPNTTQGKTGGGYDPDKKDSVDVCIQRCRTFKHVLPSILNATSKAMVDYFVDYYFALIGPLGLTIKDRKTGEVVSLTAERFEQLDKQQIESMIKFVFRLGDINAQRYTKQRGGYPYWHSEIYPQAKSTEALHRILLFMFYLNDVEEGGETDFFYQKTSIAPKAGTMVIAPAGFTHTHRGNVPKSNDKYILTSWVLFNPSKVIYGAQ